MFRVEADWRENTPFERAWIAVSELMQQNIKDHPTIPTKTYVECFQEQFEIELVTDGDDRYVAANFKSKEHYVLWLLEWS